MADALSRKSELAAITNIQCDIQDAINNGMQHDLEAKKLLESASQGKNRRFWVEDGLLFTTGGRFYAPKFGSIRCCIIKQNQDTLWAGHLGHPHMRALIEAIHFWPCMRDDMDVRTCLMSQKDKAEQRQPQGLIQPLPI
ncbi:uncharacterized protein [Solanum lycopersicum]|uniref:uncharacterized protein n=1 Tax=Solanum lycopersicum TaxID=4081 RepID=UPI0037485B10